MEDYKAGDRVQAIDSFLGRYMEGDIGKVVDGEEDQDFVSVIWRDSHSPWRTPRKKIRPVLRPQIGLSGREIMSAANEELERICNEFSQDGEQWWLGDRKKMERATVDGLPGITFEVPPDFGSPKELTMSDLRRDCFPKSYTWWTEQPEKVKVIDSFEEKVGTLVGKILGER